MVADILLPLFSTVERDFVAIIVRVNPTTERKVMACSRFDTPPSCTVDNASFLVAVNLSMHLRCFCLPVLIHSSEMLTLVIFQDFSSVVPP